MPIQTHTKEETGGHCVVRAYDQDGKEYTFSFYTTGVPDVDALIVQRLATLDVRLADAEFAQIVGGI